MSNGHMWIIVIPGVLIFLTLATIASNIANLVKALTPKPADPETDPSGLVEFVPYGDSFGRTLVNPANVTHLEHLTGEGGTAIHLVGGARLAVGENLKLSADRLNRIADR